MTAATRAHYVNLLLNERSRLAHTLDEIADASPGPDGLAVEHVPGIDADAGGAGAGHEDDDAIALRESAALAEVDEAIRLLYEEPQQYGVCVRCGRPISAARLELVPTTRVCERHATA